MRFIRKIKRENARKEQRRIAQEMRKKGLTYDVSLCDWVPVKVPKIGHNSRKRSIIHRRKLAKNSL